MGREFMGVLRTTFLIDKKGKIIKIWDNVKVKDHAKEVLDTLKKMVHPNAVISLKIGSKSRLKI